MLLLQLQQVPAAGESTKVPVKDQQQPMSPIVAEPMGAPFRVRQLERNRGPARLGSRSSMCHDEFNRTSLPCIVSSMYVLALARTDIRSSETGGHHEAHRSDCRGSAGRVDRRVGAGRPRCGAATAAAAARGLAGRRRQGLARRAGQPAGAGDGHQVEGRLHLRHVEEGNEPPGLLRPNGTARAASVLGRVHQHRQPGARRAES